MDGLTLDHTTTTTTTTTTGLKLIPYDTDGDSDASLTSISKETRLHHRRRFASVRQYWTQNDVQALNTMGVADMVDDVHIIFPTTELRLRVTTY